MIRCILCGEHAAEGEVFSRHDTSRGICRGCLQKLKFAMDRSY